MQLDSVDSVLRGINTNTRTGDWILTFSGVRFWPLDPRSEEIFIADIAHALSNLCRFGGHVKKFYSVGQHSVLVSNLVPSMDTAWALMHDASEAFLVDLPRPIKRHSEMGDLYRQIESRLMRTICKRFNLPVEMPKPVERADNIMLMTEKRDLMPYSPYPWRETEEPMEERIVPVGPKEAERMFLERVGELGIE